MSSQFSPHGKHLIAGEWCTGEGTFQSDPAGGPAIPVVIYPVPVQGSGTCAYCANFRFICQPTS